MHLDNEYLLQFRNVLGLLEEMSQSRYRGNPEAIIRAVDSLIKETVKINENGFDWERTSICLERILENLVRRNRDAASLNRITEQIKQIYSEVERESGQNPKERAVRERSPSPFRRSISPIRAGGLGL